jgi:hypothetical protein
MVSWKLLSIFCLLSILGSAAGAESLVIAQSTVTVHVDPKATPVLKALVLDWIKRSAHGIASYYGYFPVPTVDIDVRLTSESGVFRGVTYQGRRINIQVGENTTTQEFIKDWEMTHEMFHLALPLLDDDYDWMGEGLSDYLEPIARVHNHTLTEKEVWKEWIDGFPRGLPQAGDEGLDHTHTWGRTYWGGALFWFLADVEIRKRTHNSHSLHDAVQAILDAGGNGRVEWELERLLTTGDRATGTTVLHDLHQQMGDHPYAPPLADMWKELGVIESSAGITFDDQAPLAFIRQHIVR